MLILPTGDSVVRVRVAAAAPLRSLLMSPEIEKLFESSIKTRKILEQVLPKEAVDYITLLITKDLAHKKYIKLAEDNKSL